MAYALDQSGEVVTVDDGAQPDELHEARLTPLSEEQASQAVKQQTYGTAGQQAIAGVEGVASGASAGWSRNAEAASGIATPEDIQGRADANPGTALAGNVLGFGGLAALTGGMGAGVVEGLGAKMAAGALSQAAYGAGSELSEEALDSAPFNAEAVLQSVGINALVGGATEGLWGLAGKAAPLASDAIEGALGKLGNLTGKGFDQINSLVHGKPAELFTTFRNASDEAAAAGGYAKYYGQIFGNSAKRGGDELASLYNGTNDLLKEGRATRLEDVKASLFGGQVDPTGALEYATNKVAAWREAIDAARADRNIGMGKGYIDDVTAQVDRAETDIAKIRERINAQLGLKDTVFETAEYKPTSKLGEQAYEEAIAEGKSAEEAKQYAFKVEHKLSEVFGGIGPSWDPSVMEAAPVTRARPPKWTTEASEIWKALDDTRSSLQDTIPYDRAKLLTVPQRDMPALRWAQGIARDAADSTKDTTVWGDVGGRWAKWQEVESDWLDAKKAMLKTNAFGNVDENLRRTVGPQKFSRFVNQIAKEADHQNGRVLDNVIESARNANEELKSVYANVPNSGFNPDKLEASIGRIQEAKSQALEAHGMIQASKELGGRGGFGLGRIGLMAYAGRVLGVAPGAMAPMLGAYEIARTLAKPVRTLEAYGKLTQVVKKLQVAIPAGAKTAVTGLISGGTKNAAKAIGSFEAAKQHMLDNHLAVPPAPGKKAPAAETWFDGVQAHHPAVTALANNPGQAAAVIGHAASPLPEKTRLAAVALANQHLQFANGIKPPITQMPGITGKAYQAKPSRADALTYARNIYAMHNPLSLYDDLRDGKVDPSLVDAVRQTRPETYQRMAAAVMDEMTKHEDIPIGKQAQLAAFLGSPPYGLDFLMQMQSTFLPEPQPPPGAAERKAGHTGGDSEKSTSPRKFKSDYAAATRLPSNQPIV